VSISATIQALCDEEAVSYNQQSGHGLLSVAEAKAWRSEFLRSVVVRPGYSCLDVGAGTGTLTHMLASMLSDEGKIVSQDISGPSLEISKASLPAEFSKRVDFLTGDIHDQSLFSSACHASFDLITARQSAVLLVDPIKVFSHWRDLLKVDGRVVILDALWTRESWSGQWEQLIDQLPLSCLQSLSTIPYLLHYSGFEVESARYLDEVNEALGLQGVACPRFIVVARRL